MVVRISTSLVSLFVSTLALAQTPVKPTNRAEAVAIIADARRIVTPDGVERVEKLRIGGIDQWVSIRGTDRRNPVLLHIHGGPGYVSIPMSWWFGRGWEEYFTVVQWDQRAAGKTHLLSDPKAIESTVNRDRMIADAEEMLAWVRKEFGKEKVFVMGHSWGSYLGLDLARRHPRQLHAYIGVTQMADAPESERRGWQFAIDAARREGNAEAIRELEAIAPYSPPGTVVPLKDLYTQRKWVGAYGGVMAYRKDNAADSALARLSPDYTDAEITRIWEGNNFAAPYLLPEVVSLDMSGIKRLDCPLILFLGRKDINVNSEVAAEWFAKVKAPRKQLVWFEHSAHMPMTEEPGKFLVSLVSHARPIAERAGDVAR
ncbi:pimeloyl-ACP methyl ester carboxylesterase [Povalibacter uvarum]|uniref:Proline iminopeptidase n=1 Tax=Povalibacter uvarum TaxID=732238 RepID=A0A841HIC8_9GAMM|nr:alpha/beta hydrolase [Povalibacter uvarum]MBB6092463.1 pimeloyl-ACP methyl ester carboxylesterase [Povalibacter uvarum]